MPATQLRTRARKLIVIATVAAGATVLAAFAAFRLDEAIRVATGLTSHTLCSAVFVSGLNAEGVYAETIKPTPGLAQLDWALRYTIDTASKTVSTTWMGRFGSKAIFRDGLGCLLVRDQEAAEQPLLQVSTKGPESHAIVPPAIAPSTMVDPVDDQLRQVLDAAFNESAQAHRGTKAIVVVHEGRVIAERYAAGYRMDTPLLGWSMTKSVINAFIGILVREGRLVVNAPAPVPEWQDATDPRHAITIDELMRMTSGLALEEWDTGFDPATHMLYLAPDMAAFAQSARLEAQPGSKWEYTSGNTIILSRIVRDVVGGSASAVLRFAEQELFQPLGMRNVTVEFDATGTPIGSTYMYASARDWARFGLLYLNDGMVAGRRILPKDWVRYSTTPTVRRGYGAGWWTNREPTGEPLAHNRLGLPGDAFWAAGALGQRILVVPSERLVIVRLGVSRERLRADVPGMAQLAADIIAALPRQVAQRHSPQ